MCEGELIAQRSALDWPVRSFSSSRRFTVSSTVHSLDYYAVKHWNFSLQIHNYLLPSRIVILFHYCKVYFHLTLIFLIYLIANVLLVSNWRT